MSPWGRECDVVTQRRTPCGHEARHEVGRLQFCDIHWNHLLDGIHADVDEAIHNPTHRSDFARAMRDVAALFNGEMRVRAVAERLGAPWAKSVVYFVEREGYIKIGTTRRLTQRLASLGPGRGTRCPGDMTPGPVVLLGTMPGDGENERAVHELFRRHRVLGTEWFRDAPEIRDFIAQLEPSEAVAS